MIEKLFYICCVAILLAIVLSTFGCSNKPAPWKWNQDWRQEKVIPPPICERVNTITYGKEAECKP